MADPSQPNGSEQPSTPAETADSAIKPEPDLDPSIEQDIDMNADGTAQSANADEAVDPIAPAPTPSKKETSLREFLSKMDDYAPIIPDAVTAHYLTLAGLPPPGTGPNQTPPHLARLLALATQKFVSDIAADSYQFARIRASNSSSANNPMGSLTVASGLGGPGGPAAPVAGDGGKGNKANTHLGIQRAGFGGGGSGGTGQGRTVLTMEDLGMAVSEYGVTVKRGEFYR
ncbi:Transcription initiation factor TFIID 23-30kDa subunit [Penicillium atrosanguineum]|uniref:Transcription initiation factor TFIID subunit 10 n=1 Tax=Penicillium atrosanguineum TaxID=1132637 RepID=A0A9W9QC78_9EURO|nr:DASH complex subunit Dad3 [Penicillium atrosanguineum]KAJ5127779.1 Transcription initiation factor TFIID 23-30kDa subunit [Penicillium atrosanguineum]KAJ5147988.1 Transcription initiation factor TFIID 23-30kDa subunit [Penicillium atrosanguineum]KAJ5313541.1 DASH complex subunit Dad3 [Penicillium atrosanguineum]KAJ5330715.1 Transcription initiation factor TFIID 23-30kDa subunit [Penicillium atrosanguineum]